MRISIYDKELAKSLIDAGRCTRFDINIAYDHNSMGYMASIPTARVDITLLVSDRELLKLIAESLDKNSE